MKIRWKIFLTTVGISGLLSLGMYFSYPVADASISPAHQEKMATLNEVSNAVKHLCPALDPGVRDIIVNNIDHYSRKYNLDPILVVAIIYRESGFRILSVSSANCIGLMQINPAAHKEKVQNLSRNELFHIGNNINIGCQIFKQYYKDKHTRNALKRYVGGSRDDYVNAVLSTYAVLKLEREG